MKKIPDGSIDLVLTDPPYGTTACKWDTVIPFEPMWEQLKRVTKPNAPIVFTSQQPFTSLLIASQPALFKYELIWEKSKATGFLNARRRPLVAHENIVVFSKGTPHYFPQMTVGFPYDKGVRKAQTSDDVYGKFEQTRITSSGTRYPRSVLYFKTAESEGTTYHKTQKPIALIEYLIRTFTEQGQTTLDFTMGSGTTGVACKNFNRNFIGIELDETYYNIAKQRIENTP